MLQNSTHASKSSQSRLSFCLESSDFDADYKRLKEGGVPIETEPNPDGAREPGEEGWRRVVFKGLDGESIAFRG